MLLSITNSSQPSKQILREESEILQEDDENLVGKKSRKHINDSSRPEK